MSKSPAPANDTRSRSSTPAPSNSNEKESPRSSPTRSFSNEKDDLEREAGTDEYVHANLKDLDVGLSFAAGHYDEEHMTEEESNKLRRKIDKWLLPLLCLVYTVQFIDK